MTDEIKALERRLAAADARVEKALAAKEAAVAKVEEHKEKVRALLAERDPILVELQEARRNPANEQVIGAGDQTEESE